MYTALRSISRVESSSPCPEWYAPGLSQERNAKIRNLARIYGLLNERDQDTMVPCEGIPQLGGQIYAMDGMETKLSLMASQASRCALCGRSRDRRPVQAEPPGISRLRC
jgi:hypothetical protein